MERFQTYSHDPLLGGSSPEIDGGPLKRRNRASLAPKIFHENTQDKTLAWKMTEDLINLRKALED